MPCPVPTCSLWNSLLILSGTVAVVFHGTIAVEWARDGLVEGVRDGLSMIKMSERIEGNGSGLGLGLEGRVRVA